MKETVSDEALEDQWGVRSVDKVQHTEICLCPFCLFKAIVLTLCAAFLHSNKCVLYGERVRTTDPSKHSTAAQLNC